MNTAICRHNESLEAAKQAALTVGQLEEALKQRVENTEMQEQLAERCDLLAMSRQRHVQNEANLQEQLHDSNKR